MSHGRPGSLMSRLERCTGLLPVLCHLAKIPDFPCCQSVHLGLRNMARTALDWLRRIQVYMDLLLVPVQSSGVPAPVLLLALQSPRLRSLQKSCFYVGHRQRCWPPVFRHWDWGRSWGREFQPRRTRDPIPFLHRLHPKYRTNDIIPNIFITGMNEPAPIIDLSLIHI